MSKTSEEGAGQQTRATFFLHLGSVTLFIVAAVALLARTMMGSRSFTYPILYPQVLLIAVIALLTVVLFSILMHERPRTALGGSNHETDERAAARRPLLPFWGIVVCIAYISLWNTLGHALSTVLFMFTMLLLARERHIFLLAALVVVFPIVIWFVFDQLLRIPLPGFILF